MLGADTSRCLRLAFETGHGLLVRRNFTMQHFDGDPTVDASVLPLVDGAHSALSEEPNNPIFSVDDVADLKAHWCRIMSHLD